ncbi:amidohydrolase [Mycobacterium sp. DL99]|uniref:amidohydrolase n=1 Tax=Mycobacterium sp. DL99 TaxID=2528957 RepID=UPI001436C4C7|nr:amidohydrolase [Mycobacterium sp. DL99]
MDLQFDTRDAILAALRNYAPTVAGGGPVRGFGWRYDAFPATGPRREDLDAIWPDRPVLLIAIDAHSAWVNTKTLELAGITKDSADPVPGFSVFQRDPDGTPTGYLVEVPAYMQVLNSVVPMDEAFVAESLAQWAPRASEAGITSMFDAGVEIMPEDKAFGHYRDLETAGKLPFRVTGSYYYNQPNVDPLPKILALREGPQTELVHVNVLKIVMDGVDAGRTAAMLAPYADQPGTSGQPMFSAEQVNDVVKRADAQGIDVHVHCIGDRATRMTLDAIEAAAKANPQRDRRNAIAHLQCVDPQDIPRLGELGVIAQVSAQWATPDPYWRNVTTVRLGPERADRMYPFKSLSDGGARLSFGSDWPAASYYSTFRPLEAIEIAVTRQELGKPDQTPLPRPEERLTLDRAITAQTMGPAYQLRRENDLGSITVGKLADLVVLDKDLTAIPPHEIHQAEVKLTMMNGVVRHEK